MRKTSDAYHSGSCGVGFVADIHGTRSNQIVRWGIEAVKNLTHRGAVGADGKTGDGAGVLFEIPGQFFLNEINRLGYRISHIDNLSVGFFFLWKDIEPEIGNILKNQGFKIVGWRDVPTFDSALGESALSTKANLKQLFLDAETIEPENRELRLYLSRKLVERMYGDSVYVSSLSSKTIVYKGMLVATNLDWFYPDLKSAEINSSFCIFHQRFSTNTFPEWSMAQPFRILAHNGEINTIRGNRNWMVTIAQALENKKAGIDSEMIDPIISFDESDSASLDRIIELLLLSGFSPEHAINMCIPPVPACYDFADNAQRETVESFLEYQSLLMKPWDGPAAIVLTDGDAVVAHLDRNGLRPLRYLLTEDGLLVLGSEVGMVDLSDRVMKEKGRLGPGETISLNVKKGSLRFTPQILAELAEQKPYKGWIDRFLVRLGKSTVENVEISSGLIRKQIVFGYTSEEIQTSLKVMAEHGKEMTFSMGDDTPLPSLSEKPQLLFRYFKQRFSQVTNPPIDQIRERMVMSLRLNLGHKLNFLEETPVHARRLHLDSPVLFPNQICDMEKQTVFRVDRIPITFIRSAAYSLSDAVRSLQDKAVESVKHGSEIIILSDSEVSEKKVPIPCLLAVSASFKSLRREGLANRVSLILETGEARDVHQMACLIGFNASAICPYLALQTIKEECNRGHFNVPFEKAALNYKKALEEGLLKVLARMGISTLNSYYGSHLFDSLCLKREFVEEFFSGISVNIESDGMTEIEDSLLKRHASAFESSEPSLDSGGIIRFRKGEELHAWSPSTVLALKKFVKSGDYNLFKEFSSISDERPVFIRHLLTYKKGDPVSIEEVEPEESILRRFFSGAMSVGALSPEAHETIAEACNILRIKSNSGEGGEDPERYWSIKNSAIKQVASGRFGVTPAYIASALELEIKIAQGAKPGEGGHLPAKKVTEYIAKLRHCPPYVLLISPPPHHDIYSIEDLAQLINDLKHANPKAKICVKLVSESGVGTVAAGVAKSYADIVQISGCEGGTGAAYISSIKNAGSYWEIGLAETQRVLIENGLRERIKVRVDGGLRTGRDIIIAALLGAEEFGFGTAMMISAGCVMARQCHLNTCPTGVATQDEKLRARFRGSVQYIMTYFRALAREVREKMAEMGVRQLDEIIGRTDLLSEVYHGAKRLKVNTLCRGFAKNEPRICRIQRNDNPSPSMNDTLLEDLLDFVERAEPVEREYRISNTDRSVPIKLNYYIALRYRDEGLPLDTLKLTFRGVAGQSFGAFTHKGLHIVLIGDANDYVGKGMFGGKIIIKPSNCTESHKHMIIGNTVLYGATGGEFYAAGRAGERFAVRNSGTTAVVEGTGHHLCEYMTMGTVAVLGEAGCNVGGGMTGGVIYILDEDNRLKSRLNDYYVRCGRLEDLGDVNKLRSLIENHHKYTGSLIAGQILDDFDFCLKYFKKVVPLRK
ncbi:MAG: glutamate synthase large subunit [Nitrospirota bacterium]